MKNDSKSRALAYSTALASLRRENEDRFHEILTDVYESFGLGRPRPSRSQREAARQAAAEEKRQALIAKHRAALAALDAN